ncbi:hypothetical protein F5X99DRAFT_109039 [Biscogniauxia marginata]|nr:hypothetical protein F5X99DRAFT_109039 [Biscogniauxia marginata]
MTRGYATFLLLANMMAPKAIYLKKGAQVMLIKNMDDNLVNGSLGKVFEKGQAYVALSRAVSQEGLQVLRFEKNKVMAHPRVIRFYNQLYSAESAVKTKKAPGISEVTFRAASTSYDSKGADVIDLDEEEAAMAAA